MKYTYLYYETYTKQSKLYNIRSIIQIYIVVSRSAACSATVSHHTYNKKCV